MAIAINTGVGGDPGDVAVHLIVVIHDGKAVYYGNSFISASLLLLPHVQAVDHGQ